MAVIIATAAMNTSSTDLNSAFSKQKVSPIIRFESVRVLGIYAKRIPYPAPACCSHNARYSAKLRRMKMS